MAQKITSKNLSYDDTLPPFLARLRGQHAAAAAEPDPILASRRRAAKTRSASEEAEDAPLVVDEDGQEVVRGVTVGRDGVVTAEVQEGALEGADAGGQEKMKQAEGKGKRASGGVATIGGSKKRKVGKVVGVDDDGEQATVGREEKHHHHHDGDDDDDDDDNNDNDNNDGTLNAKKRTGTSMAAKTSTQTSSAKTHVMGKEAVKGKKRAKKVKLSFGDDDSH